MKRFILYGVFWGLTFLVVIFHPGYRWTWEKQLFPAIDFALNFSGWTTEMKYRNKYGKMFNPVFRAKYLLPEQESVTIDATVLMNTSPLQYEAFWLYHLWPHPIYFGDKETSTGYVLLQENDSIFLKLIP